MTAKPSSGRPFPRVVAVNRSIRSVAARSLRLYVAGDAPSSRKARDNFARFCAEYLLPTDDVKVIDILVEPGAAETARILATPTLIYEHPTHPKRIIGDLSDYGKVLGFLGIEASPPA